MALINCPECGRENVSDSAHSCPNCGFGIRDYCIKVEQDRVEKIRAAQRRLEEKAAEEKRKEERQSRIDNVAMPEPPKKPFLLVGGVFTIGLMWLAVAFVDGFNFFWFIGGAFFCVVSLGGIFDYEDKKKKYELAQSNFKEYQEMVVIQEDNARDAAEKIAKQKALEARLKATDHLKCPKCGSTYISTMNRGYSLIWGFIGSGSPINVCQKCGYKFKPGK